MVICVTALSREALRNFDDEHRKIHRVSLGANEGVRQKVTQVSPILVHIAPEKPSV